MDTKTCKQCQKNFLPVNERENHPAIFCGRGCFFEARHLAAQSRNFLSIGKTKIPLTQGKFALIDAEDFDRVSNLTWHLLDQKKPTQYAITNMVIGGKMTTVRMHRFIMKALPGVEYDHRDGDGLNNRKFNLRKCTSSENSMNSRPRHGSTSKYKGVCRNNQKNKWRSTIKVNGKYIHLGNFKDELAAALAYDAAALKYFGEFARPNVHKDHPQTAEIL